MKKGTILFLIVCSIAIPSAWGKRIPAPKVDSVLHNGVRYLVPNDNGRRAYVEAWDIKTGNKMWEQTIFINKIEPPLEEDVQWVFIKGLQIENGDLLVTDEHGHQFILDLKTKKVTRLK